MTPKASDQFGWVPTGDRCNNAIVGSGPPTDDADMAYGFQQIADIAVDHWITHGPDDGLLVPILYNYRHAVELLLKQALREAWACLSYDGIPQPTFIDRNKKTVTGDEWLGRTHDLSALAHELGDCFAVLKMHPADETMAPGAATIIGKLHNLDPRADAFRYAHTRKPTAGTFRHDRPLDEDKFIQDLGKRKFVQVEYVNVDRLREVCGNAITYLQGSVDYLIMYREDQGL